MKRTTFAFTVALVVGVVAGALWRPGVAAATGLQGGGLAGSAGFSSSCAQMTSSGGKVDISIPAGDKIDLAGAVCGGAGTVTVSDAAGYVKLSSASGVVIPTGQLGVGTSTPGQKIHMTDGNFLIEGGGQTAIQMKTDTDESGSQPNPIFAFGREVIGGAGFWDWRVLYTDDYTPERPIFSQETTGTLATVADNQRRSGLEQYEANGQVDPDIRLNEYTGVPGAGAQVELGRGAGFAPIGGMTRPNDGGTTVTVITDGGNSFVTGDNVDLGYNGPADPLFPAGTFSITVANQYQFTYTQSGTAGSNTLPGFFSVPTDAKVRSAGANTVSLVTGPFGSETTALTCSGVNCVVPSGATLLNTPSTGGGILFDTGAGTNMDIGPTGDIGMIILNSATGMQLATQLMFTVGTNLNLNTDATIVNPTSKNSGSTSLSTGAATATVTAGANCVCNDASAVLPCRAAVSSTTLTMTVTGGNSDTVTYICL